MRPKLMARRCTTCIFRAGNLMRLRPGRFADVVAANRRNSTALICHTTLLGQADTEAVCRGFYDAYGHETASISVIERMFGGFEEVEP